MMDHLPRFRADLGRLCDTDRVRLLVAVSGGPDSLALLLLAQSVLGARCLAATVDHALRPESRAEADHVAAICAARGIGHAILSGPLPPRTGRTANLSARARVLRYDLLQAHADATGCDAVATAHHADDQLETMIMRLNRGAGVGGIAGIRARSAQVVRPLLGWRRAELAAVVAAARLTAVVDPSNTDPRFDRARLRAALDGQDWLDPARWGRSAAALAEADAALDWAAARLLEERCARTDAGLELALGDAPPELARRMVIACLRAIQPDIELRGDDIGRLLTAEEGRTMLGDVLIDILPRPGAGSTLRITPAPPRRSEE